MSEFKQLLIRAGVNKSQLAARLGMTPRGISKWKDNPPGYAIAYLKLLIEYNRYAP